MFFGQNGGFFGKNRGFLDKIEGFWGILGTFWWIFSVYLIFKKRSRPPLGLPMCVLIVCICEGAKPPKSGLDKNILFLISKSMYKYSHTF